MNIYRNRKKIGRYLRSIISLASPSRLGRFGKPAGDGFFEVYEGRSGSGWFVPAQQRLSAYYSGVEAATIRLLSEYRIDSSQWPVGSLVIDVGANVGLFGYEAVRRDCNYLAVEPDPRVFEALSRNMVGIDNGTAKIALEPLALSDFSGHATFFTKDDTADSSLMPVEGHTTQISVEVTTLDVLMDSYTWVDSIALIKIEAEGSEPEVIRGGIRTIQRALFVAVDAGPERNGEITAPEVVNQLSSVDFELVDCFLGRGTFLFRNRRFS